MRINRYAIGRAGTALLALVLVLGGTPALANSDKISDIDFELSVSPHHEGKLYDRPTAVGYIVWWHRETVEVRVVENGQNVMVWVDTGSGFKEVADPANPGTYQVQLNPAGEETLFQVWVEERITRNGKPVVRYQPANLVIYRMPSPQARGESPSGNKGTDSPLGALPKPATPTESNPPPAEPPDDPPGSDSTDRPLGAAPKPATPTTQPESPPPTQPDPVPQTSLQSSTATPRTAAAPPDDSTTPREALERLVSSSNAELRAETLDGKASLWMSLWERPDVFRGPGMPRRELSSLTGLFELSSLTGLEAGAEDSPPPEYEDLADRLGVSRAFAETSRASEDVELSYLHYGGWMDHSFFFVSGVTARDPATEKESFGTFLHSMGNATGANPVSGGATWKGAMAGFDVSDTADRGNLIEGDATVTIDDFEQPVVDVALTGLRDRNADRDRASITWEGVPLADGAFASSGLQGQFYGPDHEEAGGVFLRDGISGAFGAKRQ